MVIIRMHVINNVVCGSLQCMYASALQGSPAVRSSVLFRPVLVLYVPTHGVAGVQL